MQHLAAVRSYGLDLFGGAGQGQLRERQHSLGSNRLVDVSPSHSVIHVAQSVDEHGLETPRRRAARGHRYRNRHVRRVVECADRAINGHGGVGRGDRVATLLANCHRTLEAYAALPLLGAVIVPLNTRQSATELRAILADCGARLLLADARHRERAAELASAVEDVLLAPEEYERAVAQAGAVDADPEIGEDDLAAICYTGGTSGRAKGVMLSHRNLVANAFNMTLWTGYDEGDTFLHAAPMFHVADAGSIFALMWRGARHAFARSFDPPAVLDQIARERDTCTVLVPTMISMLIEHPNVATADLRSLRRDHGPPVSRAVPCRCGSKAGSVAHRNTRRLTEASSMTR